MSEDEPTLDDPADAPSRGEAWAAVSESPERTTTVARAKPSAGIFPEIADELRRPRVREMASIEHLISLRLD